METPSESTSPSISVDNKDNKKEESTVDSLSKSIYLIQLGDANYDESLKLAEQYKTEGNKFLQENSFALAIAKYTQAIELKIETPKNAIYYSNRAFVNTKIENYGSAIEDANEAIKCDPTYLKAYFRRSSANLCLFKYDEALKDLMFLLQKLPGDAALKDKIDRTKKLKKNSLFWECFSSEGRSGSGLSLKALYDKYTVEPSYSGSKLPEDFKYDLEWIKKLIENLKNKQYLHKKYLLYLMIKAKEIFEKQPSLIDVNFTDREITVCGDIHGQFYDLVNIFEKNGYPSEDNPYLFNGDFIDRGTYGIECITVLLCFKVLYPNHFFLARGNHEAKRLNKIYGFEKEVCDKYNEEIYNGFGELFNTLPLGHIINKKIMVVHGGIFSKDGVTLDQIKKENRFREIPDEGIMSEILWSDPSNEMGRHPSKREMGMTFGPDVAEKFLKENGLDLLICSHEVKQNGYEILEGGKVYTVFSAPNYCDQMGNLGAYIRINPDNKLNVQTFEAVPHPKEAPMKYMNNWMF